MSAVSLSPSGQSEPSRPRTSMPSQATGKAAEVRAELGVPSESLVLLYVGRLSRPKNMFSVVDAFAQLKNRWPRAVLLMAAKGGLEEPLAGLQGGGRCQTLDFCASFRSSISPECTTGPISL